MEQKLKTQARSETAPNSKVVSTSLTSVSSLKANFIWTLAGNVVYSGAQWGMLTALARFGSPEMVGRFALGLAITSPIILFSNLKLRAVQATDAQSQFRFSDYLGLRLFTTLVALLSIIFIAFVSGFSFHVSLVIIFVALAKSFDSISDIFYAFLQRHERMQRISISMMIQGVIQFVCFSTTIAVTRDIAWGALALALSSGLVTVTYDIRSALLLRSHLIRDSSDQSDRRKLELRPRLNLSTVKNLGLLGLPLGLSVALSSLWTNIPRYFIQYVSGERELGIFAALSYLLVVGSTIINALGQSAVPRLATYVAARDWPSFDKLLTKLVAAGSLLGILGIILVAVAGSHVLSFLYGREYAQRGDILLSIMIAQAIQFSYNFLGTSLGAMRNFKAQAPIHLMSCLFLIVFSALLIPRFGLLGASWSLLATAIFEFAAYIVSFRRTRHVLRTINSR